MFGYKKTLSTLSGVIERLQVLRRSNRRRVHDNKTKKWAERSIWSMVCATDLGLVTPIKLTTNNSRKPETRKRKNDTVEKPASLGILPNSRKSIFTTKPSRFIRLNKTKFSSYHAPKMGLKKRKDYSQKSFFHEHPYALPAVSSLNEKFKLKSRSKNHVVYNHFNIHRTKKIDNYNRGIKNKTGERENRDSRMKRVASSRENSSSEADEKSTRNVEKSFPTEKKKKIVHGDMRISGNQSYPQRITSKCVSPVSTANNEKSLVVVEEPKVEKSTIENPRINSECEKIFRTINKKTRVFKKRSNDEKLREAISMSKEAKVIKKKSPQNDYDDSEIDESLLVDPFTDLPESLLETIDENIVLVNSQFDVSLDLNFESDEQPLSSTFEFLGDNIFTVFDRELEGILKKSTEMKTTENSKKRVVNKMAALQERQNGGDKENIMKNETAGEKRKTRAPEKKRSADALASNKMAVLQGRRQNGGDKENASNETRGKKRENRTPEKRRSADAIIIANKMAVLQERQQNGVNKENIINNEANGKKRDNRASEKKKSSDDSIINNKMALFQESRQNGGVRVTRQSLKNGSTKLENNVNRLAIGTIVWGNCMGWWPGFIVDADDVGMSSSPDKSWICWIGEYRISHLRDKTQIQSFSTQFHDRMIETLRVKTFRDQNYRACLETLKLVNDQILDDGPLTKPYHLWAEKHLTKRPNIDRLILHPYPPNVQPRLDEFRRTNARITKKYLAEMSNMEKVSTKNSATTKSASTTRNDVIPLPGHLPLIEQKPGVITWAKIMGQPWWPAVIMDYRDCGMKEPNFGCQWIFWYGDDTMSQVNHRFFLSFVNGMSLMANYAKNCKREVYRRGVVDAAKDYCSRLGYRTDDWTITDVFTWFARYETDENSSSRCNVLPGIPGNEQTSQKYPARIVDALRRKKGNCTVAAAREHSIEDSEILTLIVDGKTSINDICLMCLEKCPVNDVDDEKTIEHPFFVGKLCSVCAEKYKPTIFAYGDDGKCFFCTVCAGSDTVVMCDEEICPRVYCTACLKYLIAPNSYYDIMHNDPWLCFLCDNSTSSLSDGHLKPREDWKDRVSGLFRSSSDSVLNGVEDYKSDKRKIRVLSLFDGISAGMVVLKKLGIQIDAYYASEIDRDAEMISSAHFGNEIIRLGDVRSLTEEKIREISPIDLLIGGSPCNDLSLVNPLRLGLHDPNGTGILVFEYCRIKDILERAKVRHFFWLFENVASMPSKYRIEINEHLGREPNLIDSAYYSPQHRPRLYWGNLPIVSFPLSSQDLQDVLTPNCNRHALVKKIRTVTTRVNSLKQGKDSLKPILMNEINDTLWITELEEIFGFPRHYTDVKNLCATKRQKLIAMSWSVQTITEIMRPLCNFFHVGEST